MSPYWNGKTLGAATLCVGGAAVLLHPASLMTLGLGVWLGCRGRDWVKRLLENGEAVL